MIVEFNFAEHNHAIGSVNYQVDLHTAVYLRLWTVLPAGYDRSDTADTKSFIDLVAMFLANPLKSVSTPA